MSTNLESIPICSVDPRRASLNIEYQLSPESQPLLTYSGKSAVRLVCLAIELTGEGNTLVSVYPVNKGERIELLPLVNKVLASQKDYGAYRKAMGRLRTAIATL